MSSKSFHKKYTAMSSDQKQSSQNVDMKPIYPAASSNNATSTPPKTAKSRFDTSATTVSVDTVACPLDDKLREKIQEELTRHFIEEITKRCQRVKKLADAIEECLKLNDGWMQMEGDILYFSKINAVMPRDLRRVPNFTFHWSRTDGTITEHLTQGEVPRISSSLSVGSLPGVIPTRTELEKILTSSQIQSFQNSRFNEKRKETHLQKGTGGLFGAIGVIGEVLGNFYDKLSDASYSVNNIYFAFFEKKFSSGNRYYDNSNISFEFGKHENYQEVLKQTFEETYLNPGKGASLKNILGKMTGNWLHDTTEYPHGSIGFADKQSDELLSYLNYFYYKSSYNKNVLFYSFNKQQEIYKDLDVHDVAKDLRITWHALPICRLHNGGPLAREEMNRRGIAMLAIWSIFQLMPESIYTNRELNEMANSVNERIKALELEGQSISDPENLYKLSPSEYTPILGGHGFIANELIKPLLDEFKTISGWIRENPEVFNPDCETFLDAEECLRRYENGETVLGLNKNRASEAVIGGRSSELEQELRSYAMKNLLECDYIRSNITPVYTESYLTDPQHGVWDLWGVNAVQPGEDGALGFPCQFIAHNPAKDIHEAGLIAIDFGTKSTIVVRHNDGEEDRPLRIGESDLANLKISCSSYENPTVMQLRDIQQFSKAYRARVGRPFTRWDDMLISHDAEDAWKGCEDGKLWTQFLTELKQWAGSKNTCHVIDGTGYEMELPPYLQIGDSDFDPLEIYAYLLGLQINNMRDGIYLRYEMSYPVKYDKPVLDRLYRSFERGLRKSLPKSILADEKLMKRFTLNMKTSEPAAYALCALQEYRFDLSDEKQIFYGVFDFGGGTTDFDYGIYREGNEKEQEANQYYVLEHFKPSGDGDLGGEKLLQLIAYDVLKSNKAILMNGGKSSDKGKSGDRAPSPIVFSRPYEKNHTDFAGSEVLVDDNLGWANINLQRVMEELRPLWEESNRTGSSSDEAVKQGQPSSLTMTLYDRDGEQQTNIKLEYDAEHLRQLLRERIEQGVASFFEQLSQVYKHIKETYPENECKKVYIFLAGNSCKSPLVYELFEKSMKWYASKDKGKMPEDFFDLYPPLGTPEAEKKQKERGIDLAELSDDEKYQRPSGKTGVAFGLVIGRAGGDVKILDGNMKEDGISFRYHVGRSGRRGIFEAKLTTSTPKNTWVEVMSVGDRDEIELKYTDSSQAWTMELPASKTKTKRINVQQPEQKDCKVFVRATAAATFEVAIAKSAEEIDHVIEKYELE